jgi:hypothetical protein
MRWLLYTGLAVALLTAGLFAWRVAGQAGVAVFLGERDIAACRADDPPGFEQIAVEIDVSAGTATASAFGLITRRARHSEIYGCTLEP